MKTAYTPLGSCSATLGTAAPRSSACSNRSVAGLEPVYGFRSLLAFKSKFQPEYRPLYLTYPQATALPAIGTAVARAYLPDLDAAATVTLLRRVLRQPMLERFPRPADARPLL